MILSHYVLFSKKKTKTFLRIKLVEILQVLSSLTVDCYFSITPHNILISYLVLAASRS